MDLNEIAEAYQLVYEKKKLDPVGQEDDDVDNDGDSDSSDEYLKKQILLFKSKSFDSIKKDQQYAIDQDLRIADLKNDLYQNKNIEEIPELNFFGLSNIGDKWIDL